MTSVTLAESAKLGLDELVQGVIENIITVDRFFDVLPFDGIEGNALAYDRENTLGAVATTGVGDADGSIGPTVSSGTNYVARAAAKNPATFTQVTSTLTTIMGDAEVNGLIQATRSNQNNQTSVQIASKAKQAGRTFRSMLINGDGTNFSFPGLLVLVGADQMVPEASGGANLSFVNMDYTMDLVTDKDGQVDYLMMHARTIRSYKALLRGLGGANIGEVVTLPSGAEVPAYSGVPIFRNDYIPITLPYTGAPSTTTTWFAGTLDDGARKQGIAGLTAQEAAGLMVEDVGVSQTKDERIWRVKWYCGLAMFSEKGLAADTGVLN